MNAHSKHHSGQDGWTGLVPRHLNYGDATTPFIYDTISALQRLSDEPAVEQFVEARPEDLRAIQALARAVTEAGLRVRATHAGAKVYDEHLRQFTAEEIWEIDLAVDVVAMLVGSGGVSADTRRSVFDRLRRIDEHVHSHHWKAEVRKAGAGPAAFRELRQAIPHHKPGG